MVKGINMGGYFYRYEDCLVSGSPNESGDYGTPYVQVHLRKYDIVKTTPKGVWVKYWGNQSGKKFILLKARKQFACVTEEEARKSFLARKARQLGIYHARIRNIEEAIRKVSRDLC